MRQIVVMFAAATVLGAAAQQAGSTNQGVYTTAQATRGQRLYGEHCEQCHGSDLGGSDFGDGAPRLKRADFMAGRTLREAFDRTKRSMPFDAPGSLPDQSYVDILSFLLRENGHPPGSQEMSTVPDALGATVVGRRPPQP